MLNNKKQKSNKSASITVKQSNQGTIVQAMIPWHHDTSNGTMVLTMVYHTTNDNNMMPSVVPCHG